MGELGEWGVGIHCPCEESMNRVGYDQWPRRRRVGNKRRHETRHKGVNGARNRDVGLEMKRGLNQGINKVQRKSRFKSNETSQGRRVGSTLPCHDQCHAEPTHRAWLGCIGIPDSGWKSVPDCQTPVDGAAHERTAPLIGGAGMSLNKRG